MTGAELKIRSRIDKLKREVVKLQKSEAILNSDIKELQGYCEHNNYEFHAKACAEDDSHKSCNVCDTIF